MATLAQATLSDEERRVVAAIVERLGERFDDRLQAVWLFGSRARGERPGPESDVDLMAVTDAGCTMQVNHAWALAGEVAESEGGGRFDYDLRVWDAEWLANRREIRSFFIQEVDRDRIILWERS